MNLKKFFITIALIIPMSLMISGVSAKTILNDRYVNYNGIEITSNEYDNLLNLGFTEKEIFTMDVDEFNNNKNLIGEVVSETTKYYQTKVYFLNNIYSVNSANSIKPISKTVEISEEEYNNSDRQVIGTLSNGYVETNYKKMTSTIIAVNGRYRYKNTLVWKNMPSTRSHDIIGIGIDSTVSGISSTKYIKTTADISDSSNSTCYYQTYTSAIWKMSGSGYAATFKLPDNTSSKKVTGLNTYMYFEVQKLASTPILTLNAYGDYSHAQKTVSNTVGYGVSIGTGGIGFDVSVTPSVRESFDSMSTAQATISGLYW